MKDLPMGMPESSDETTVLTFRDDQAGYILFTPLDSLAVAMKKHPVQAVIKYEEGHMKVGMEEGYTVHMLSNEFWAVTQNQWDIYPVLGTKRLSDRSVVRQTTENFKQYYPKKRWLFHR
jgi:hypothetical protein